MSARRGRPPEVDPHELSLVALGLFERDGFELVTMDDIARAASVSRRTLFRLFPSKVDLVWHGLDEVLAAVKVHTPNVARATVSLDDLVEKVLSVGLAQLDDPAAAKLARRRLRLIAACPQLLNHQTLRTLQATLTTLVTASSGPKDPPPALVSGALFAVSFAAVLWWVQNEGSMTVGEALRTALRALPRAGLRRAGKIPHTEGRHT